MDRFAIQIFEEDERCTFYTVRKLECSDTETDLFFDTFQNDYKDDEVLMLIRILKYIGKNGANKYLFRFENRANALPRNERDLCETLDVDLANFPLRLYCYFLNRNEIILFNGGIKDSATAQESQLSMKFHEANQYAKILDENLAEMNELAKLKNNKEIIFP